MKHNTYILFAYVYLMKRLHTLQPPERYIVGFAYALTLYRILIKYDPSDKSADNIFQFIHSDISETPIGYKTNTHTKTNTKLKLK